MGSVLAVQVIRMSYSGRISDSFCADRFGQSRSSGDGAVCDGNVFRFLRTEMSGTELNHFPGTDKQDVGVF